jgi:hypothetical protein
MLLELDLKIDFSQLSYVHRSCSSELCNLHGERYMRGSAGYSLSVQGRTLVRDCTRIGVTLLLDRLAFSSNAHRISLVALKGKSGAIANRVHICT